MTKIKPSEFAKIVKRDVVRYRSAAVAALYDEAVKIINKSIPITPYDKGHLRGSAFVSRPKEQGNQVEVELGYGGFASKYALAVHEMGATKKGKGRQRNAKGQFSSGGEGINWSEPGTGNKYLEKPFDAASKGQAKRLQANAMKRFLSRFTAIITQANTEPK